MKTSVLSNTGKGQMVLPFQIAKGALAMKSSFTSRMRLKVSLICAIGLIAIWVPQLASAALVNGDFSAGADATNPPSWNVVTGANSEDVFKHQNNVAGLEPQDGVSGVHGFALFTGNTGTGYDGAQLSQTVSVTPNALHTLSFYLGKSSSLTTSFNASVTQSVLGDLLDEDLSVTTVDGWDFFTYGFTPTASSITISFEDISATSINNAAGLDTVLLTFIPLPAAPVPEPSTGLMMLSITAIGWSLRRRRRTRFLSS